MSNMDVHFSSERSDYSTPDDFFSLADSEFNFTLDVCASAVNAKCANYYDEAINGLAQEWTGRWWMNPPYGSAEFPCKDNCNKKRCEPPSKRNPKGRGYHIDKYVPGIGEWVAKGYSETKARGSTGVCLLPARTDTAWWHAYVMRAKEIRFISGRITFELPDKSVVGAPFPSVLVVYDAYEHWTPTISSLYWNPGTCQVCCLPILKGAAVHPSCRKE